MAPFSNSRWRAIGLAAVVCGASAAAQQHRGPAGDADRLQYVVVNGVRLAYRAEGRGVPVIFVHGESHSHELWGRQLDAVSAKHFFVSYDRRGHGQSEDPVTGYSPVANAEDLNGLLNFLALPDAHFVVNSRGGAVIMQFLRWHPEKVRSLVFADATIALANLSDSFRAAVRRYSAPPPSLEESLRQREARKDSSFYAVARTRPDVKAVLDRMIDQYSPRVTMNPHQAEDQVSSMDIGPWNAREFPDMTQLRKPVLLVVGEKTDPYFIDGARKAANAWPRARLKVIPGADHLLALEAAELFNRLILDFFAWVDAAR
jgi:pimeloyl-ACP methyl ester carboxylesterase